MIILEKLVKFLIVKNILSVSYKVKKEQVKSALKMVDENEQLTIYKKTIYKKTKTKKL